MTHPQCSAGTETVETLREKLQDPIAVHLNMLRGDIAKPSWANIKHLYPEQFPDEPQTLPMQPTESMLNAARDWSIKKYGRGIGNDAAIGCWQAMLCASLMSEPMGNPNDPGWVKGLTDASPLSRPQRGD
jgi:hypothetical protein